VQTLHGIRFLPIVRVRGTFVGLDARWLGRRGLVALVVVAVLSFGGSTGAPGSGPWRQVVVGLSTLIALLLTSLAHELGHACAGRLAGLQVRAVVLAPEGGLTIRSSSNRPDVDLRTAIAGPLANAVFASLAAGLALYSTPESFAIQYLSQLGSLQLLTGLLNLLPVGPLDGAKIVRAWRAC
jgi:Zn-dependent protease